MSNFDPELAKAAQQAYERSNASLRDYDPRELSDEDKVTEIDRGYNRVEPVTPTADNVAAANAKATDKADETKSSSK